MRLKTILRPMAVGLMLLAMAACTTTQLQLATVDTCATNAAVLNGLADLRAAGKLTAAQIAKVDADIALIDPICSASSPATALTGAAATAARELATILKDPTK